MVDPDFQNESLDQWRQSPRRFRHHAERWPALDDGESLSTLLQAGEKPLAHTKSMVGMHTPHYRDGLHIHDVSWSHTALSTCMLLFQLAAKIYHRAHAPSSKRVIKPTCAQFKGTGYPQPGAHEQTRSYHRQGSESDSFCLILAWTDMCQRSLRRTPL